MSRSIKKGPYVAPELLKHHPEIMAYFIYADNDGKNKTWFSESLKGKIVEK